MWLCLSREGLKNNERRHTHVEAIHETLCAIYGTIMQKKTNVDTSQQDTVRP